MTSLGTYERLGMGLSKQALRILSSIAEKLISGWALTTMSNLLMVLPTALCLVKYVA
jgi:hypothetical protein